MTRIRGLRASFGISKPIAGRMMTAFAGTPSFTAASQSRTVGPSTAPHTTLSARAAANHKPVVNPSAVAAPLPRSSCAAGGANRRVSWAVRTRSCVREKCSFKSKRMVNPLVPQVRRQVIEELLWGSHWRNVDVHHEAVEMAREVAGGACPRDLLHAQEYPVFDGLPPTSEGGILGQGFLASMNRSGRRPKSEHAIQRNSLDSMDNDLNQRADSACSMSGTASPWATQESTNRRGVVGFVGPGAQLA